MPNTVLSTFFKYQYNCRLLFKSNENSSNWDVLIYTLHLIFHKKLFENIFYLKFKVTEQFLT